MWLIPTDVLPFGTVLSVAISQISCIYKIVPYGFRCKLFLLWIFPPGKSVGNLLRKSKSARNKLTTKDLPANKNSQETSFLRIFEQNSQKNPPKIVEFLVVCAKLIGGYCTCCLFPRLISLIWMIFISSLHSLFTFFIVF